MLSFSHFNIIRSFVNLQFWQAKSSKAKEMRRQIRKRLRRKAGTGERAPLPPAL